MKKRKLALSALGLIAVAALASCGDETTNNQTGGNNTQGTMPSPEEVDFEMTDFAPAQEAGRLDVITGYNQTEGSITPLKAWTDPITNEKYTANDRTKLLRTWENLGAAVKADIHDQNNYSAKVSSYNNELISGGFKGKVDETQIVDLYNTTTSNINKGGGTAYVALDDYLDIMPNFSAFLQKNPQIRQQITYGGHIYFTPYFDGYNGYERSIVMDVNIAYKLLDKKDYNNVEEGTTKDENGNDVAAPGTAKAQPATATTVTAEYDNVAINGTGAVDANVLQAPKYQPFMGDYNLPEGQTTVKVLVNGAAQDVTFNRVENIIKQQNNLLKNGATGKQLAEQLIKYLNDVIGTNKSLYPNLADYYVGGSAAYTVDELIALMRVVKANPGFLTGDASAEVECLFPRQTDNTGRIDNVLDFAQVWGVQGLTAESEALYFDAKGHLNDAYSTRATYDALEYMSQIYDEGLIDSQFYNNTDTPANRTNDWFAHKSASHKYGFMEWDYTATQSNGNTMVNGVGAKDSTRADGSSQTGIKCILPPLTYWSTETDQTFYNALSNHEGKQITRYLEENRALKSDSWAIPMVSDNITGACVLMDYLFSKAGQTTFDFVGSEYWTGAADSFDYNGVKTPEFNAAFFDWFTKNPSNTGDFWKYIRLNYGASLGIGYVRTASINYQATNYFAQEATKNMEAAIKTGVVNLALVKSSKVNDSGADWATSAPAQGYNTPADMTSYSAVPALFSTVLGSSKTNWCKYVADPAGTYTYTMEGNVMKTTSVETMGSDKNNGGASYSYKDVIDQIEKRKTVYLQTIVDSDGYAAYSPFYLD